MRVRTFELRLIAAGLTALWAIAAGIVLLAYRPGGPVDLLVGVVTGIPIAISLIGLLWPPRVRGDRAFAGIVWLGLSAGLLLVPSIGGVLNQLLARGPQTLLPSLEAAYPWILALAATSLFAGLGVTGRRLPDGTRRSRRLIQGLAFAALMTLLTSSLFGGVAIANEIALRDREAAVSRFGPTTPGLEPPTCADPVAQGPTATIQLTMSGDVDLRPIGTVQLRGERSGGDFRWTADVATNQVLGQFGLARLGANAWRKDPRQPWVPVDPASVDAETLDTQVLEAALMPGNRQAAEERGLEFVEGARARHCRIAIDGPIFRMAFPQVEWFAGDGGLHRWRGQLDYWIFGDGELGQVSASVNGDAIALGESGLLATIRATLTATDRGAQHIIVAPAP